MAAVFFNGGVAQTRLGAATDTGSDGGNTLNVCNLPVRTTLRKTSIFTFETNHSGTAQMLAHNTPIGNPIPIGSTDGSYTTPQTITIPGTNEVNRLTDGDWAIKTSSDYGTNNSTGAKFSFTYDLPDYPGWCLIPIENELLAISLTNNAETFWGNIHDPTTPSVYDIYYPKLFPIAGTLMFWFGAFYLGKPARNTGPTGNATWVRRFYLNGRAPSNRIFEHTILINGDTHTPGVFGGDLARVDIPADSLMYISDQITSPTGYTVALYHHGWLLFKAA